MKIRYALIASVLLLVLLADIHPQDTFNYDMNGSGGVIYADGETGLDLTFGMGMGYKNVFTSLLLADVGLIPTGGGDRYYMDAFSNGQSRCRDRVTGRFAPTSACHGVKIIYAVAGDINFVLPTGNLPQPFIGIGIRGGTASTAYASFGFIWQRDNRNRYFARLNAGKELFQLGIGTSIKLNK